MVILTFRLGAGFPDCVVLHRGNIYLVEIKMPDGELTPDEEIFQHKCEDQNVTYWIIRTKEDCEQMLGVTE